MVLRFGAALGLACLMICAPACAQDVTLTARDGSLGVAGTLRSYDGEYYRIDSEFGGLTIDAQGVICEGPGCPDLTAPRVRMQIVGLPQGHALIPVLLRAFATARGLQVADTDTGLRLSDPRGGQTLMDAGFAAMSPSLARAAVEAGQADLILSLAPDGDMVARAIAQDPLVPIVSPDNPLAAIKSTDLARALAGEVKNWSEIGGPDRPLVLHGFAPDSAEGQGLAARLGRAPKPGVVHDSGDDLAQAVVRDPWALAITGRSTSGAARILALADTCGYVLPNDAMGVRTGDYPLALSVQVLQPKRRLPRMLREFLDFLAGPVAQAALVQAGFADRAALRQPLADQGARILSAIAGAKGEDGLGDLQAMAAAMSGADRLSYTFRFGPNGALDAAGATDAAELALMLATNRLAGQELTFAAFGDGAGNRALGDKQAQKAAATVLAALHDAVPDLPPDRLPVVRSFANSLPIACDKTAVGRQLNLRVELWARPKAAPATGN